MNSMMHKVLIIIKINHNLAHNQDWWKTKLMIC